MMYHSALSYRNFQHRARLKIINKTRICRAHAHQPSHSSAIDWSAIPKPTCAYETLVSTSTPLHHLCGPSTHLDSPPLTSCHLLSAPLTSSLLHSPPPPPRNLSAYSPSQFPLTAKWGQSSLFITQCTISYEATANFASREVGLSFWNQL